MKTLQLVFVGLGLLLLVTVAGAAVPLPPRLTWTLDPPMPESIAAGASTTHTVTLKNTGFLPIVAAHQLRIDVEGDIIDYVALEQPVFGKTLKRNDAVTFSLTVSVPEDAQAGTVEGVLVLKRVIGNKVLDVWRAEALPLSISIRRYAFLNDTGIILCSDASHNDFPCPVDGFPGQDAEYGRDVTHNDDSDGHAGFSFTKLDIDGNPLPIQNGTWDEWGSEEEGSLWSCVRDNVTGRIWEVKTDDDGLQDKDWKYTWYNPDSSTNGGDEGVQDGGVCIGSYCDTEGYVQAVNAQGLCGANDWRMPTPEELLSIVASNRSNPSIDAAYFPNTRSNWIWSSSSNAYRSYSAWSVGFAYGYVYGYLVKSNAYYVRLVRGGQ